MYIVCVDEGGSAQVFRQKNPLFLRLTAYLDSISNFDGFSFNLHYLPR